MPKKDGEDYIISETGNWNVADQYSKSKIMRPLNLCDYYEDIANFGYESIVDEIINFNSPSNDFIKIKAIKRLVRELIRLIDNTKFALKIENSKKLVLQYKIELQKIEQVIPKLIKIKKNNISKTSKMFIKDPLLFQDILNQVSEIKSKINEPLNRNHLIFTDREEFDPIAFKNSLKERMVNKG